MVTATWTAKHTELLGLLAACQEGLQNLHKDAKLDGIAGSLEELLNEIEEANEAAQAAEFDEEEEEETDEEDDEED